MLYIVYVKLFILHTLVVDKNESGLPLSHLYSTGPGSHTKIIQNYITILNDISNHSEYHFAKSTK